MNIYILDDQEMILEAVAEQLSEYAGSITVESNPGLALEHLVRNIQKYDLIISDYNMGFLNGAEVYNVVSSAHKNLPPYIFFSSENPRVIESSLKDNPVVTIIFKSEWDALISAVISIRDKVSA